MSIQPPTNQITHLEEVLPQALLRRCIRLNLNQLIVEALRVVWATAVGAENCVDDPQVLMSCQT